MKIKDLKELLQKDPEAEIEIVDGEIKVKESKSKRWKPEYADSYYSVLSDGAIDSTIWDYDPYDEDCFAIGNVFKTPEEAERVVEVLKIRAKLLNLGGRTEFKQAGDNWVIKFDFSNSILHFGRRSWTAQAFNVYFDTEEEVEHAVETIGEDRVKKFIFGVQEETK